MILGDSANKVRSAAEPSAKKTGDQHNNRLHTQLIIIYI